MNPLINDEKHYVTLSNYLKSIYHEKVFKVSLNGNFSCPNRDGTISSLGCLFCSAQGSGDFAGKKEDSLPIQFQKVKEKMEEKWPNGAYIAYFQANTNTYGSIEELRQKYTSIITPTGPIDKKIKILSIATRPDCFSEEIYDLLSELAKKVTVWIELGFQTKNEITAQKMNRGYKNIVFENTVRELQKRKLTTIVHIINGLPGDSAQDMLDTAKYLAQLGVDGIKIHMLHVMKDTPLALLYEKEKFSLLTLPQYVSIVASQLEVLPDTMVIHRLTGDAPKDLLIEPTWTLKKFVVLDEIDKYMRKNKLYQGDKYVPNARV
jgi:radical SAM protein (TIGR01212 family)